MTDDEIKAEVLKVDVSHEESMKLQATTEKALSRANKERNEREMKDGHTAAAPGSTA